MSTAKGWNPEQDLTALLDALTEDLLTASDHEIAVVLRETRGQSDTMVREVRRLLAAAEAGLIAAPASDFASPGLRAFVARNQ